VKRQAVACCCTLAVLAAGCEVGDKSKSFDAAYLNKDLPKFFDKKSHGTLSHVNCVQSAGNAYDCVVNYDPSTGTSAQASQFQALGLTGQLGMNVTLDPDTGAYNYEFVP
jgi:hypothetical protein